MEPGPSISESTLAPVPAPGSDEEKSIVAKTRRALTFPLVLVLLALAATLSSARPAFADRYGLAVIVGNGSYANERVPEVAYAHRDAEAFKRYVLDVLGFDPNRVFDLRDATQAELFTWFGNQASHEGRLWRYLHPRHGSDVVVFYSGHGVPGLKDRRGYLLPSDADPDTPELNGYPIDLLYTNLGKLAEAKSVWVFLEACFSGESDGGMLVRSASPVYVQASLPEAAGEKLTVLSAASGKEVASWDEKVGHGMFTHHLLDALYGQADADGDGQVTAAEAKTYLDDTMTIAARVEFGRYQTASLVGPAGTVLARAGTGGAFPARPSLDSPGSASGAPAKDAEGSVATTGGAEDPRPVDTAESVEASLSLTHGERVLVQHGLSSLGEAVGVADGVFGRRTRAGIRSYQEKKGLPETGYLAGELREALVVLGEGARAEEVSRERKRAEEGRDILTATVTPEDLHGSIAFSQLSDGGYAFGIAWNAQGSEAARRSAIEECERQGGGSGCREAGWFRNACGAIAIGDHNGYGTGWGETNATAEDSALSNCRSANRNCHVEVSRCVDRDYRWSERVADTSTDMLGSWSIDWQGANHHYTGTLRVDRQLASDTFHGWLDVRWTGNETVRQEATITISGNQVVINCSNPNRSEWAPDNFFLTLSGNHMEGHSVDSAGRRGSRITFSK